MFFFLLALGVFGGTYSIIKEKNQFENEAFHQASTTPAISGPDRLCNVFGSVIGTFSGGGNPNTDVYSWQILGPSNQILFIGSGGGGFQTINYTFSITGPHQIRLKVSRGGIEIGNLNKTVEVIKGPLVTLLPNYSTCENTSVTLRAISTNDPSFSNYQFLWKDEFGIIIGNQNELEVKEEGKYSVEFFFINALGEQECSTQLTTQVSKTETITLISNATSTCPDEPITFISSPVTLGNWFLQKKGTSTLKEIGRSSQITISPVIDLDEPGEYIVFFESENTSNSICSIQIESEFQYLEKPEIKILDPIFSSACNNPNGAVRIEILTFIDELTIEGQAGGFFNLTPGDIVEFSSLKSGSYTVLAQLGNCSNTFTSIVPLDNPPNQLEFEIEEIKPETCTEKGKLNGSFKVNLTNGPFNGYYRLKNDRGALLLEEPIGNDSEIIIEIQGGTYYFEVFDEDECVLPQLDQIIIPNLELVDFSIPPFLSICQSFDFIPQTNQELEFTLIFPNGSQEKKLSGDSFEITQEGEYLILGTLPNQSNICPVEKSFEVTLVEPVNFEPILVNQDCFGNRTYKADILGGEPSNAVFRWYNEKDELVGTGQFLNPTSFGNFKLDVQPANSESCPINPFEFKISEPILSVDLNLTSTKLCEFGPKAIIDLSTTFQDEITDVEWRKYDDLGTIVDLPQFKNLKKIIVEEEGTYEAAVFSRIPSINKDCELGRSSIRMDLILDKVNFEIPGDLSICDPFELIPESSRPLIFTLTYPDGKEETKNLNEPFTLNQEGSYTILGFDPDPKGPECPEQKTFEVKINPPVQFSLELVNLDCNGIYEYEAEVTNYLPSEVDFFWFDPSGTLVSNTSSLSTSTYGEFRVEIQPSGSIPCENQFKTLFVPDPILQVSTKIIAEALCPDQPNAVLKVDANLEPVQTIHWWFTDLSNNRRPLSNLTNQQEILAFEEGTYEVQLLNRFNCLLGQDQTLVIRSTDQVRPELDEAYQICPKYDIAPTLSPGNFASYEWIFEGNLVSTSSTFKPLQIGSYEVIVTSAEGCAYQTSFITEEECELRLRLPNAIQPENPDKPFLIYTNYLVDELEVWIYNKWGNLIFHCKNSDLIDQESTCLWDGLYNGKKVPPGAYAFRINYQNYERGIKREQLGTVQVIE